MLPIRLRFQGLHSYKSVADIDFTKLVDARLFGIFGATGSGKSTILEAITLALFSQSERLGSTFKYAAVNLSAQEMWIEFTFSQKNKEYLFEIKYTKSKKDIDSAAKLTYHKASEKKGNQWVAVAEKTTEVKAFAETILEIDADNFRRTTIIPQGKFQDFLTLTGGERGDMMINLFKLDQFDLTNKVIRLRDHTIAQKHNVEGQLSSIQPIDKVQLEALKQSLNTSTLELKVAQAELGKQEIVLNLYEHLALIDRQYNAANEKFEKLIAQKAERENQYEEAKRYERSSQTLNPIFDQLKSITKQQLNETQNRTRLEQELQRLVASIAQNKLQLDELLPAYNQRETITEQATAVTKAIEWHELNQKYKAVEKEVEKYELGFDDLVDKSKLIQKTIISLQKTIENLQTAVDGAAELEQLKAWYQRQEDLIHQQKGEQQYWNEVDADVNKLNQSIAKHTNGAVFKTFNLDPINPDWEHHIGQLQLSIQEKENEKSALNVRQKLAGMAHTLVDGKPCPLCGATEHPEPLEDKDVKDILAQCVKESTLLQNSLNELANCKIAYEKLKHEQVIAVGRYKQPKAKLADLATQIDLHAKAFVWTGYKQDDKSAYLVAKSQLEEDRNTLNLKRLELNATQADLQNTNDRVEKGKALIETKKQEKASLNGQLAVLAGLVNPAFLPDWQSFDVTQLRQEVLNLQHKRTSLEARHDGLMAEGNKLSLLQNTTETSLVGNEKQLSEIGAELTKVQISLTRTLNNLGFGSQAEAEQLLAKFIHFEHIDADYQVYKTALAQAQGEVLTLAEQLKAQPYNNDLHGDLLSQVEGLRKTGRDLQIQVAQLQQTINLAIDDLTKREALMALAEQIDLRLDRIKKLQDLFRGKGFVQYISRIYLEGVVRTANVRFKKMTRNQLALSINETTEFFVTDYLNDGKTRPVRTLSGGQTFQAALCLALSLSELIAAGENQFFFLDEGFGTQDKDALNEVVNALQSLQKEGRVVGIISHVEELKQLLDVSLLVENDPINGSTVSLN